MRHHKSSIGWKDARVHSHVPLLKSRVRSRFSTNRSAVVVEIQFRLQLAVELSSAAYTLNQDDVKIQFSSAVAALHKRSDIW